MRGTSLCAAIEARSYEIAEVLLTSGCDVNARDFDGEPPLILAIRKASPVITKIKNPQLSSSMRLNQEDQSCLLNILPLIINNKQCNLNKVDPITKQTAIHFAIAEGLTDVVAMLMDSKSTIKCNVNARDTNGETALHLAVMKGDPTMVRLLLQSETCLETISSTNSSFKGYPLNRSGLSVLHLCSKLGSVDILKMLVENIDCDINKKLETQDIVKLNLNVPTKFDKRTCMHLAAMNCHTDIAEQLLEWGANFDDRDAANHTPLLLALCSESSWAHDLTLAKLLLDHGANPNCKASVAGFRYAADRNLELTPLILAAMNDDEALAKMLVKHGAIVNLADNMGNTPLYQALWSNAVSVAFFFLRECADVNVNAPNVVGATALNAVVKVTNTSAIPALVTYLVELGASTESAIVDACEYENNTFLDALLSHIRKPFNAIQLLVMHDIVKSPISCLSHCDNDKASSMNTLLKSTIEMGNIHILRVFLSHGADIDEKVLEGSKDMSLLYLSIRHSEFKLAEFLVNNGCKIMEDELGLISPRNSSSSGTKDDSDNNNNNNNNNSNDDVADDNNSSSDDTSESSEYDSDGGSDVDVLAGNRDFRMWLEAQSSATLTLELSCLVAVRKYFLVNQIPFAEMELLPVPVKLVRKLRYRE